MTPNTWAVIKSVFGRALDVSARQRSQWLKEEKDIPGPVRQAVRNLLTGEKRAGLFDPPAGESKNATEALEQFAPGTLLLGRFEIVELLGRGGMGEVYAAYDREVAARVAIKTVSQSWAGYPEFLEQTRREIRIARLVNHPNVCRVFDVHREQRPGAGELVFLTMDLLDGETLQQQLDQNGPLPEAEVRCVADDILAGLEAIHAAGVVHRDLKSSNVLRLRQADSRRAVILDFGLARDLNRGVLETGAPFEDGSIAGTPAYMAPEQMRGQPATPQTDLYALGVLLFQTLTGELPFPGQTPLAIALRKLESKAPRLRNVAPHLDRRWDEVIASCLEANPESRPKSATAVRLSLALSDAAGARRTSRRRWMAGSAAGAAAAIVWLWGTRRHKPLPAALVEFKRGEEFARRRTAENIAAAIGEYSQAVTIDPLYAEAWGGLADAYSTSAHFVFMDAREARVRAEKAAQRALSLDPHLAKAHSALAYLRSLDLQKWRDADPYFRKALQSYAEEPLVHVWYAAYLGRVGRHDDAVAQARTAVGLDPASMSANHQLAVEYFRASRIVEYLAQARELVKLQPLEASGRLTLTRALEWSGDFAAAEEQLRMAVLYGSPEKARSFEVTLRVAEGRRADALQIARTIRAFWEKEPMETNIVAGLYGSLGLGEDVADILEQGYQRGDSTVLAAATNPYLRSVKQNARVQNFLTRLGY